MRARHFNFDKVTTPDAYLRALRIWMSVLHGRRRWDVRRTKRCLRQLEATITVNGVPLTEPERLNLCLINRTPTP